METPLGVTFNRVKDLSYLDLQLFDRAEWETTIWESENKSFFN